VSEYPEPLRKNIKQDALLDSSRSNSGYISSLTLNARFAAGNPHETERLAGIPKPLRRLEIGTDILQSLAVPRRKGSVRRAKLREKKKAKILYYLSQNQPDSN
jgi:hypothetical protein